MGICEKTAAGCLYISPDRVNFTQAVAVCTSKRLHLVSPISEEIFAILPQVVEPILGHDSEFLM